MLPAVALITFLEILKCRQNNFQCLLTKQGITHFGPHDRHKKTLLGNREHAVKSSPHYNVRQIEVTCF